tara:strand:+ start:84403 stop:85008 length:606 start_codon:yes stop_codon:yes gene_type:complete
MMHKENSPKFWEDIYLKNDIGWDLNGPTPIFLHLSKFLKTGKVCIVGCGRGFDAVMFAKKGFDVMAVDFAPSAIKSLKSLANKENVNLNALEKDIFSIDSDFFETFDYVIEQTCFCAIHPSLRSDYEELIKKILKPYGKLIGLWFPLDKPINEGGPPYGTTIKEVKRFFNIGWKTIREEFSNFSVDSRIGREKLIIFQKVI